MLRILSWCGFFVRRLISDLSCSALRAGILRFSKEHTSGFIFHIHLLVCDAVFATLGEGY
jgi:hypothetical protein